MRIKYTGSKLRRRIINDIEWSVDVGLVQHVTTELAAELLTLRTGEFHVDESDPLMALNGITESDVISLVLAGVDTVEDLRELDKKEVNWLVKNTTISQTKLREWANPHEE